MIGEEIVTVSNNNKDKQKNIEEKLNTIIDMLAMDIANKGIMRM